MNNVLFKSGITRLPLRHRSKVRDIYGIDGQHLLKVTTERLSGAVLPTPIPGNFNSGRNTSRGRWLAGGERPLAPCRYSVLPHRNSTSGEVA